jgi:hypothetical protein
MRGGISWYAPRHQTPQLANSDPTNGERMGPRGRPVRGVPTLPDPPWEIMQPYGKGTDSLRRGLGTVPFAEPSTPPGRGPYY